MRLVLRTSLVLALALAQACPGRAAEQPFFRFNACRAVDAKGTLPASCNPTDTGRDTVVVREEPLAFARAEPVGNGSTGDAVSAAFAAQGGSGSYTMALENAPVGFTLMKASETAWTLVGSMNPSGSYPNARVALRDAVKGTTVYAPIPVVVTDAPPAAPVTGLSFDYMQDLQDRPASTQQMASFGIAGGKAPFSYQVTGAPATVYVATNGVASSYGDVVAQIDQPGEYTGVRLRVSDATGASVDHTYPRFTISAGSAAPLVVGAIDPVTPVLRPGESWTSQTFSVSGGNGLMGYRVEVEGRPYSTVVTPVDADANGYATRFRITVQPNPEDVGSYPNAVLRVSSRFDWSQSKLVVLSPFKVAGDPLEVVTQYPAATEVAAQSGFSLAGAFKGGSGNYQYSFTGLPDDGRVSLVETGQSGRTDLAFEASVPDAKAYTVTVTVLDWKTGESVAFAPFKVTGKATPISECTDMPKGAGLFTAEIEQGNGIPSAFTWKGGVGPYTLTPSQPLPGGLGLRFDPGLVGTDAVRGMPAEMEPTAVASVTDLPATLRDSKGSSCTVLLNAASTAAPEADPSLVVKAEPIFGADDGYGRRWINLSSNNVYFMWEYSLQQLDHYAHNADYCQTCAMIKLVPPPGKEISDVRDIKLQDYRSAFNEHRDMLIPSEVDAGGWLPVPGLRMNLAGTDDPLQPGTWQFRFYVRFTDGTAGLTENLSVNIWAETGPMPSN